MAMSSTRCARRTVPSLALVPAVVVLIAVGASPRLAATAPLGYHIAGDLRLDASGFAVEADTGTAHHSVWLQEGLNLSFQGHLWRPGFLQVGLGGQAFTLHQFVDDERIDGSRKGFNTSLTLLPWSYFPLTFYAQHFITSIDSGVVPSRNYYTTGLGIDWRLTAPTKPRFYLSLRDVESHQTSDTSLPAELRISEGGLAYDSRTRSATATLVQGSARTNMTARYAIEERADRTRDPSLDIESDSRLVIQSSDLHGHVRVSDTMDLDVYSTGRVHSIASDETRGEARSFDLDGMLRYAPVDEVDGAVSFHFNGDSSNDALSDSARAWAQYRPADWFGLNGAVTAEYTDYGDDAFYDFVAAEMASFGAWIRGEFGQLGGTLEGATSGGATHVEPGESGVRTENRARALAMWRASAATTASFEAHVDSRRDWSSAGGDDRVFGADARVNTVIADRVPAMARAGVLESRTVDRRSGGAEERRRELRLETSADAALGASMTTAFGVGYRAGQSNQFAGTSHDLYTYCTTAYWPGSGVAVNGSLAWFLMAYNGQVVSRPQARIDLSWYLRKIALRATYSFEQEDRTGLSVRRHVVWLSAARFFNVDF